MHRFSVRAAAVLLALTTGPLAAAPAQALENPVDITSISTPKVVITSRACRDLTIGFALATSPRWQFLTAQTDVYRYSVLRDDMVVPTEAGPVTWHHCFTSSDLGRWSFGPSTVHTYDETAAVRRDLTDTTSKTMWVKVGARASVTSSRSGSTVRFTAVTTRYSISQDSWIRWKAPKVTLQRKRADGTWASIGTLTYTSTGTAKTSVTASTTATYRVVASGTSTVWSAASGTTRR